jgi:single-strand DNA-binding protein
VVSINYTIIGGNLTRDPELKFTPDGIAVCNFSVAVNEKYTGKDGQKKENVAFIEVVAWKKTAELSAEYLKKGSPVVVEGKLSQDNWEDKEGKKRTKTKVTAGKVHFVGSKGQTEVPIVVPDNGTEGDL